MHDIVLYYIILYYIILHYTSLYYTILYYKVLYYAILYYSILYYPILYYAIPYYNTLSSSILYRPSQRPPGPKGAGSLMSVGSLVSVQRAALPGYIRVVHGAALQGLRKYFPSTASNENLNHSIQILLGQASRSRWT